MEYLMYKGLKIGNTFLWMAILLCLFTACEEQDDNLFALDGEWYCQEASYIYGHQAYTVLVSYQTADSSILLFQNFYNLGKYYTVSGTLDFWDISLEQQTVNGLVFIGSGELSGNKKRMDFEYTVFDGEIRDTVTAILTR